MAGRVIYVLKIWAAANGRFSGRLLYDALLCHVTELAPAHLSILSKRCVRSCCGSPDNLVADDRYIYTGFTQKARRLFSHVNQMTHNFDSSYLTRPIKCEHFENDSVATWCGEAENFELLRRLWIRKGNMNYGNFT